MKISLGYFCYDLLFELIQLKAYDMILHHTFAVVGLISGLVFNRSGTELMFSISIAELSTPMLHLRFFLRSEQSTSDGVKLFNLVSYMFLTVFLTAR